MAYESADKALVAVAHGRLEEFDWYHFECTAQSKHASIKYQVSQ